MNFVPKPRAQLDSLKLTDYVDVVCQFNKAVDQSHELRLQSSVVRTLLVYS